ncbi:MAG: hypothetical protein Q9182_004540 [Xanthomendoza sp. 2 TL-2023]
MHRFFKINEIILAVVDLLDIESLLTLRLVAQCLYRLISSRESTILRKISANLCSDAGFKYLATHPLQVDLSTRVEDLRTVFQLCRARRLAVAAVATNRQLRSGKLDPDMVKEILRVVQNGLMVLSGLSRIFKRVNSEFIESATKNSLRCFLQKIHFRVYETADHEVSAKWMQFMKALPIGIMIDFNLAVCCILEKHAEGGVAWMHGHPLMYRLLQEGLPLLGLLWSLDDRSTGQQTMAQLRVALNKSGKEERRDYIMWAGFWDGHTRAIEDEIETAHQASWYRNSPFKFRIGPGFQGATPEQLVVLRRRLVGEQALCCYLDG